MNAQRRNALVAPGMSPIRDHLVVLTGGIDQITPSLSLKPGMCRDILNFEIEPTGGYTRIAGYERFSGKAKPSDAGYIIIQLASFTNIPTVGQTLAGVTSGATGKIIAIDQTYIVLTLVIGTFTTTEVMQVGATVVGTATPQTAVISALLGAQYTNLAADVYRVLIAEVPGSGTLRGICGAVFGGVFTLYAFRDNAGATFVDLYQSSASGWTQVAMFNEVSFTGGGITAPADGGTLTQGANTALIKRVVLQSGTWGSGTAAGRFIVATPAPGAFAAGAATIGAVTVTLSGAQTAITLPAGGKYEFDLGNFAGQTATRRIFGSNGVGRCFEFDGTTLVPIATGFSPDIPSHIAVHQNHLFIGIGSSIANSGIGLPYNWTSTAGAAEIAVGGPVQALKVQPGSQATAAMMIGSQFATHILYGTSAGGSNVWSLVALSSEMGAAAYSVQNMSRTYFLDDRGVVDLYAVQAYGNFRYSTLTQKLHSFIQQKRTLLTCSALSKDRSQYRLFFSDGFGLYVTIVNGKLLGSTPVLFPNTVACAWHGEDVLGNPVSYFGGTDGMVYQMDRGSSFDGASIDAYFVLSWDAIKTPRVHKRYRRASFEVQSGYYAAFSFSYALGYNTMEVIQQTPTSYTTNFSGVPQWDTMVWDQFTWDGSTLSPSEVDMRGTAENFQVTVRSTTDYIYPFTINSEIVHYSFRRRVR